MRAVEADTDPVCRLAARRARSPKTVLGHSSVMGPSTPTLPAHLGRVEGPRDTCHSTRCKGPWPLGLATDAAQGLVMSTPTTKLTRELIRMACCAPSIHNTQPWAWRLVGPDTIELYADRSRQLEEIDPQGRALAISCGAALHHLVVAAEAFGLVAETRLLPAGHRDSNLLATIHLEPGEITEPAVETLAALENRTTDRRGFTDWEVPATRLQHLAKAATGWGAHAVSVTDPGLTATVSSLRRAGTHRGVREPPDRRGTGLLGRPRARRRRPGPECLPASPGGNPAPTGPLQPRAPRQEARWSPCVRRRLHARLHLRR